MLGNESPIASAVGEILPHNEWYDFEAKYVEGGSDIVIPARLTAEETAGIQRTSLAAFEACDLAGLARIDFFLRAGRHDRAERDQHDARASRRRASTRACSPPAACRTPSC